MRHLPKESKASRLSAADRVRLRRVLGRPQLQAAVSHASALGLQVWMVGGAIRDVLLRRSVGELDLVVSGDPGRLAQALTAAGFGKSVLLSDQVPQVFRVAGAQNLDIAEVTGRSIERDLARRDFTVNAIACRLPHGRIIDPFGGVSDLSSGRLRAVADRNLSEDPLRVLRAARLMATHGLKPVRTLTEASRRAAKGIAAVAGERIRTELVKLLGAETAAGPLRWLASVGALAPALGLDSLFVARATFARNLARLDHQSIRLASPSSRVRLRLCLIANRGDFEPSQAAEWLRRRRFSGKEAGDVATLLDLAARVPQIRSRHDEWGWIRDAGDNRMEAAILVSLLNPHWRSIARRLARPLPSRRLRVRGADLLAWLRLPPGPEVGRLLREIEIEILSGQIRSKREARKWLTSKASSTEARALGRPAPPSARKFRPPRL